MHMKWRKVCLYMIYWVTYIVFTSVLRYFNVYHSGNTRHEKSECNRSVYDAYFIFKYVMLKHGCWHEEFSHSAVPVWLMDHMLSVLAYTFDVWIQVWSKLGSCKKFKFLIVTLLQEPWHCSFPIKIFSDPTSTRIWPLCGLVVEAYCIKFPFSGLISYFNCL